MALANYIRDLSYLKSGNFSDLTLYLHEKSWKIHKALTCCHSEWFRKALTIGFAETESNTITLHDDAEYVDAVDCMVSYFYDASYNVSTYNTLEPLLHAQVAIVADKYVCTSLYEIAKSSFAKTISVINSDDWAVIAADIYEHTTTESAAHRELRDVVVSAAASNNSVLDSTLQNENTINLLRDNANLATDLLVCWRHGSKTEDTPGYIFRCDHCGYTHVGSDVCPRVTFGIVMSTKICPKCHNETARSSPQRHLLKVDISAAFVCALCDGVQSEDLNDAD